MKMNNNISKNRAWVEINLSNLKNNIEEIKKIIPQETEIMAIVKANAYGHGIIEISKYLNEIGIQNFAVATLDEGIQLRENGIKGDILILGNTYIDNIKYVIKNNLIQTIVDYDYAKKIEKLKLEQKLRVHIKINTGMNRIGEKSTNIENIQQIYKMNNISIEGMFTHLCVSDSLEEKDMDFSKKQIQEFDNCIENIKKLGYNPGKIHVQASYGILNYSELKYDYVRPGIIMYGVYSDNQEVMKIKPKLKPVLALKARITAIKEIEKNESVSYGRTFIAEKPTRIATVGIGYADGYPRNLSNKRTKVIINGKYAEIIGRICMDQLIVDISDGIEANVGDIVTLIGENEISVENISEKAETITNEVLSRLGNRLPRICIYE